MLFYCSVVHTQWNCAILYIDEEDACCKGRDAKMIKSRLEQLLELVAQCVFHQLAEPILVLARWCSLNFMVLEPARWQGWWRLMLVGLVNRCSFNSASLFGLVIEVMKWQWSAMLQTLGLRLPAILFGWYVMLLPPIPWCNPKGILNSQKFCVYICTKLTQQGWKVSLSRCFYANSTSLATQMHGDKHAFVSTSFV